MTLRPEFSIIKEFKAEELLANLKCFLSKLISQTYNGYVISQFKKPERDLRALVDCDARSALPVWASDSQDLGSQITWKHALRLLLSEISALREAELRVRLENTAPRSWPSNAATNPAPKSTPGACACTIISTRASPPPNCTNAWIT